MKYDDVSWNPDADPRRQPEKLEVVGPVKPKKFDSVRAQAAHKEMVDAIKRATEAMAKLKLDAPVNVGHVEYRKEEPETHPRVLDDNHFQVHSPVQCEGTFCAIHNPSVHRLRYLPRVIWALRVWRECPHGTRHPDPDDVAYWVRRGKSEAALQEHDCDGCCPKAH